jgi:hypothetical protein
MRVERLSQTMKVAIRMDEAIEIEEMKPKF